MGFISTGIFQLVLVAFDAASCLFVFAVFSEKEKVAENKDSYSDGVKTGLRRISVLNQSSVYLQK